MYLYSCFICINYFIVQRFEHFHVIALYKLNIIHIIIIIIIIINHGGKKEIFNFLL